MIFLLAVTILAVLYAIYFLSPIVGLVVLLLALLVFRRNKTAFVILVILAVMLGIRTSWDNNKTYDLNKPIKVDPFNIQINGDQLRIKAKPFILYKQIENKQELKYWENLDSVVTIKAKFSKDEFKNARNFNEVDVRNVYWSQGYNQKLIIDKIYRIRDARFAPIENTRNSFLMYLEKYPYQIKTYTKALFIGSVENDFYEENPGITTLGLIHLFSISGFQVSYLSELVFKFNKKIRVSRRINDYLNIFLLPIFFLFSGNAQSLIRPIISSELKILQKRFSTKLSGLDIWAITLIISIFIYPRVMFSLGGLLSFLLSLGLVISNNVGFVKQNFYLTLLSTPLIIYFQFRIHLLAFFINLLAIPVFSLVIIPILLISLVAFTAQIDALIAMFNWIINQVAQMPGQIVFGRPPLWVVVLLVILTLFLFNRHQKKVLKMVAIFYAMTYIIIHFPVYDELTFIDIGQGDSILVKSRFNTNITLIDTGGLTQFRQSAKWRNPTNYYSQAQNITIKYLESQGVNRIDNLVLTHKDNDHIGNAKDLLKYFNVKTVIVTPGVYQSAPFQKTIVPYIKNQIVMVKTGDKIPNTNFKVLAPSGNGGGNNEDSLALFGSVGQRKFFTAGDLPKEGEIKIVERLPNIRTDFIKLGHHGSKTSSSVEFLKQLQPNLAFISSGVNNRYGHPHEETIKSLNKLDIRYLNTKEKGMIRYRYNGYQESIETFLDDTN